MSAELAELRGRVDARTCTRCASGSRTSTPAASSTRWPPASTASPATHDLDELRSRLDGLAGRGDLDELRSRLDGFAGRHDVDELRGRLDGFVGHDAVDELRSRLDGFAGHDAVDELRSRLDGFAGRDELAGFVSHDDLRALHARLDGVPAREEIATREEVERLVRRDELEGLAPREDLNALRERLDRAAGRDDIDALHGRVDGLAGRDELESLRARLDDLAVLRDAGAELIGRLDALEATAEETIRRIAAVDQGAGTVLADVRALKARVDEALSLARTAHETGRAEGEELHELVARLGGELEVARGLLERAESEALGARQAASVPTRPPLRPARTPPAPARRPPRPAARSSRAASASTTWAEQVERARGGARRGPRTTDCADRAPERRRPARRRAGLGAWRRP